jgi:lipopolysaccharide export system protein LptA
MRFDDYSKRYHDNMRRLRWLLPVIILGIVGAVGDLYLKQRALLEKDAPAKPPLLADGISGAAILWCYDQAQGSAPRVNICAKKMSHNGSSYELEGLQLKLFHKNATQYDMVTSDFARFDEAARTLFSEGNVSITMAVPAVGATPRRLLKIHSSGVQFSAVTGEASTTRPVSFEFDRGIGSSVGAHYNPETHELRMDRYVWLEWKSKNPAAPPMRIEAGEAFYLEDQSKVILRPWAKLVRGGLQMNGKETQVDLKEGDIERVDTSDGEGVQQTAARRVEFGSKNLHVLFDEHANVSYILAENAARLRSAAATSLTNVTSNRMDLHFVQVGKESTLRQASALGTAKIVAEPVTRVGATTPETRILRGEALHLFMRTEGDNANKEEIDRVETAGPGTLEFVPNAPKQVKRTLDGDPIWIYYGAQNRIERFRSLNVSTRTETKVPRITESKEILAFFDAESTLTRLEQNDQFRFTEGDRKASSKNAVFEASTNLLTLNGNAATSDSTGKVTAERITLDQETGDYVADGNVSTTRQPTRKTAASSAMLSQEEILQATARRMTSRRNAQLIDYEGDAKAWQGANRVTAEKLSMNQETHIMEAHGRVETQIVDKSAKAGTTPFTIVRSQDMTYSSETRLAHYTGGVHLDRPGLVLDARELRAYLHDANADSSLEKAIADGAVKTVSTTVVQGKAKRTRTGTGEHGEYLVDEQRVVLTGTPTARAVLNDSERVQTSGDELTWWINDDRLLVNGRASGTGGAGDEKPPQQTRTVLPKKPQSQKK